MFWVGAPLLQEYTYGLVPPAPLDVTVAQVPGQTELAVVVTVGPAGQFTTVMLLVTLAGHPPLVTVWETL